VQFLEVPGGEEVCEEGLVTLDLHYPLFESIAVFVSICLSDLVKGKKTLTLKHSGHHCGKIFFSLFI
jgi:hypothetical protein